LRGIVGHGFAHRRQQRDHPLAPALAGDRQCLAQRQHAGGQGQRLGNAQACAIEQQQHRAIARRDPRGRLVGHHLGKGHGIVG
jgi:hypothetical protein